MEVDGEKIHVTHLNIRPSISVLILQILLIDFLTYVIVVSGYLLIQNFETAVKSPFALLVLVLIFLSHFLTTVYGVLQWLNEYYEITPLLLVHKKGVFWRKVEKFNMQHVKYITVNQGILGKLLNYGTITLFDSRRNRLLDLYLIHNPLKYLEVLEKLNPDLDQVASVIRDEDN